MDDADQRLHKQLQQPDSTSSESGERQGPNAKKNPLASEWIQRLLDFPDQRTRRVAGRAWRSMGS